MDETDVDSCFYHTFFDLSESQHRMVRVSRGSSKESFAIKLFELCDLKTQLRYFLQEKLNISKRKLTCLVDSLRDFLKIFDHASNCVQIPLLKPRVEIGSTKSKDNLLAHYLNDIIGHRNRQIPLSFRFGNNITCVFSTKKLELNANKFFLTAIVNLNHREIHHLYKNRWLYVANKNRILVRCKQVCNNWEHLQCVANSPDFGYENSTIILIGDV